MGLFSRQPKRTVPEPVKPPQHRAVNPSRSDQRELNAFRGRIVTITLMILALGALGYAVYGPWFVVQSVTISGTREITPSSVKAVTTDYLERWRYGSIPNNNLWLLSRKHLSEYLEKKIRERISIEEVRIIKRNRHDLEVVVIERTPIAVWKAGELQGSIDKSGTIINAVTENVGNLPVIIDSGEKKFTIGDQVLTKPAMSGWKILNDAFTDSTLTVENYLIPVPTCPTEILTPEEQAEMLLNQNINSSQNLPIKNLNTNSQEQTTANENVNGALNANANTSNTNTIKPIVVPTDCDISALAKASQEIHAKLKDGPLVLFDRHQDLALAVQTVKRLLTNQENSGATYIDIRFQERVYIK